MSEVLRESEIGVSTQNIVLKALGADGVKFS